MMTRPRRKIGPAAISAPLLYEARAPISHLLGLERDRSHQVVLDIGLGVFAGRHEKEALVEVEAHQTGERADGSAADEQGRHFTVGNSVYAATLSGFALLEDLLECGPLHGLMISLDSGRVKPGGLDVVDVERLPRRNKPRAPYASLLENVVGGYHSSMGRLRRQLIDPVIIGLLIGSMVAPAFGEQRRRRQATGWLEVVSLTLGAEVYVDGEMVGEIPIEERIRLPVGEHRVKVSKRGHTQHLEVVRIKRRQTVTVEADLLALSGVIRVISSEEGARVFVDDDYVGNAPIDYEAEPGEREVRVSLAGFHDHSETVEVIAGEEAEVAAELERLPPEDDPTIGEDPPDRRWYEQWWVWTIVGAVVVAAGITIPIVLTREGDECEEIAGWGECGSGNIIRVDFGD